MTDAPARTAIVFGTDGWRARIAEDFTFDNVRRCAAGVARYVAERGEESRGVVLAYDRRFASEHFAVAAAEVLLAHGIPVAFGSSAMPTQMSSYEVVERVGGRLAVTSGPRGILAPTPVALLAGAARSRSTVDALVRRVAKWEASS